MWPSLSGQISLRGIKFFLSSFSTRMFSSSLLSHSCKSAHGFLPGPVQFLSYCPLHVCNATLPAQANVANRCLCPLQPHASPQAANFFIQFSDSCRVVIAAVISLKFGSSRLRADRASASAISWHQKIVCEFLRRLRMRYSSSFVTGELLHFLQVRVS